MHFQQEMPYNIVELFLYDLPNLQDRPKIKGLNVSDLFIDH
jgi:hypothetical protein